MISQRVLVALSLALFVKSESHTIRFQNNCDSGTPTLIDGGNIISTGQDYTSTGPFSSAIAYLQTGSCLFNGENCTLVELTLGNPTCPGCGSSVDLSLISPHKFSVPTAFSYYGGCDHMGASCDTADCSTAFRNPNDNQVQVQCEENDVNVLITFCGSSGSTPTSSKAIDHVPSSNMTTTPPLAVSTHSSATPSLTAISSGVLLSSPLLSSPLSSSVPSSSTPAIPVPTSTSDNDGYDDDECDDGDENGDESSNNSTILGTNVLLSPSSESVMHSSLLTTPAAIPSSTSTVTTNYVTVTETVTIYGCSSGSSHDPSQTSVVPTPVVSPTPTTSPPIPVSTTSPNSGENGNGGGCEGDDCAAGGSSNDGDDCEDEGPSSIPLSSSKPLSLAPPSLSTPSPTSSALPSLTPSSPSSGVVPRSSDAALPSLKSSQYPSAPSLSSDGPIPTANGTPVPESSCIPDDPDPIPTSPAKHRRAFPWGGHRSRLEPDTY